MPNQKLIRTIFTYTEILDCTNKGEKGCTGGQMPCTACLARYDQVVSFATPYFTELLGDLRLLCNYYNFVIKAHEVLHGIIDELEGEGHHD
jgi:hypothetical protein